MLEYFEAHLMDAILEHSGRCVLEKCDNYNPYSGVTNNAAESINAKLKRLVEYRERQIDSIVLYLNYLQGNDVLELLRAFCGESEWGLLGRFSFAKRDPDTIEFPKNICHPDSMIHLIKGKISAIITDETENQTNSEDIIKSIAGELKGNSNNVNEPKTQNADSPLHDATYSDNRSPVKLASQHSLAVQAISDNGITLVPSMKAFMVKGSKETKYSVTLFPKETCNCPATTRCFHIIAVMMAIGMPISNEKKKLNLTQLRWNMRPKASKRCGTKKGRKGDLDEDAIIPAPDSTMKLNESLLLETPNNVSFNAISSSTKNDKVRKSLNFVENSKINS